ncbi:hypothetical protein G6L37_06175 [Agrobacterium rubi]|nr:hypothetical protein [Agrobacterium rubi]NTF24948.1 hypothetical protein [Agrobacterium rubi]
MPRDNEETAQDRGAALSSIIADVAARHDERMQTDARYRHTVAIMQDATRPVEPSRHYDRDGYCDNPARGY